MVYPSYVLNTVDSAESSKYYSVNKHNYDKVSGLLASFLYHNYVGKHLDLWGENFTFWVENGYS